MLEKACIDCGPCYLYLPVFSYTYHSGGGVEPPTKFSKRGGSLTGPQLLEGVAEKEGGDFFQGGVAIVT